MFWCEGVVIKTRPLGEADRIVVLYTKERGKVGTAAKGSRRPKNRLAAVVQPFTRGNYFLSDPASGLKSLSQGNIIDSNQNLRDDLLKMAACNYFLELIDVSVETEDPDQELYKLILMGLKLIDTVDDLDLALRYIEYRLLYTLGWGLQLESCVGCGKELNEKLLFSAIDGGVKCEGCLRGDEIYLTKKARAILLSFNRLYPRTLPKLKLGEEDHQELEKIMRLAWDARMEKSPKTWLFWKQVSALEN